MISSPIRLRSRILILAASTLLLAAPSFGQESAAAPPRVVLETSHGTIVVELNPEKAPITVENFLDYVDRGWYDGTVFHRVISDFMIQGGGMTPDLQRKITRQGIENESKNGLSNARGTISMARTGDPHSATAQFFINVVDNDGLDGTRSTWGYAVFGRVVEGMDVVDSIRVVETGIRNGMPNVPDETVSIVSAKRQ